MGQTDNNLVNELVNRGQILTSIQEMWMEVITEGWVLCEGQTKLFLRAVSEESASFLFCLGSYCRDPSGK